MKLTVCSVLLATLLVASNSVESSLDVSPSNHARRHHAKVQDLEKRGKFSGQATWYGWNQGDQGACGEFLPQNGFYVALNHGQYGNMNQQSSYCGKTITISNGLKSTQARILDACPGDGSTCKWGALDMSKPLFEFFNPLGVGVFPITWWISGDSGGGSSSSGSSGNSNNDDDSSDSDSGSNGAAAAKQAAQEKAAQEKSAQEKAAAAKKAAAEKAAAEKAAKEKAAKEKAAAAKKAAAKKAAKEKAAKEKAASEKAQHQNIAAFGEIMQTLNQIVENAVVSPASGAVSVSVSSASASASSSSSSSKN